MGSGDGCISCVSTGILTFFPLVFLFVFSLHDIKYMNLLMKKYIFLIASAISLSACVNSDLTTSANVYSESDFGTFKTWRWHEWEQDGSVNDILLDHIRMQIEAEMDQKQMVRKEEGEVDFLVTYIVNVRDDFEVDELPTYEGFSERYTGFDRYGRYVNVVEFQARQQLDEQRVVKQIVKGTLIIDILDPTTNKMLMRMIAEKPIPERKVDSEVRQRRINALIKDLLSNFPPKQV